MRTKAWLSAQNGLAFFLGVVIGGLLLVGILADVVTVPSPEEGEYGSFSEYERSLPTELEIPALGIKAAFSRPLGVTDTGESEVPDLPEQVGWYQYSPTPGERGPAVVLGHVDSLSGPAVFYTLGQLEPGNDIYIDREDGSRVHFVVRKLERYSREDFPTNQVYGDIEYAGLRLVTCSGLYNYSSLRYSHTLVVYAEAVAS